MITAAFCPTAIIFVTPTDLRELADDLEKKWKESTREIGTNVPTVVIIGENIELKIAIDFERMPQ